jgi:hypothetical protein
MPSGPLVGERGDQCLATYQGVEAVGTGRASVADMDRLAQEQSFRRESWVRTSRSESKTTDRGMCLATPTGEDSLRGREPVDAAGIRSPDIPCAPGPSPPDCPPALAVAGLMRPPNWD